MAPKTPNQLREQAEKQGVDVARRHTEQIVSAMLRATAVASRAEPAPGLSPEEERVLQGIAHRAIQAYRELIDDPRFWDWYVRSTPIEHVQAVARHVHQRTRR